jgi:hypothetical protein
MKLKYYIKENDEEMIHKRIKDFFKENPKPSDKQVHELADKLGIDEHEFEEHIYMLLGSLLKSKG